MRTGQSCSPVPRCLHLHSALVKLNLYADQMNEVASVADAVGAVEVVEGSMTVAATTTCVAITRMAEEEATTMEEVAEAGMRLAVADTTAIKAVMVDHRPFLRHFQTPGRRHLEAPTLSLPHHQAGYRLRSREATRAVEATEAHLGCHLRSARHGWATRLLNMADLHRTKPVTTAHLGTSSTIALRTRF